MGAGGVVVVIFSAGAFSGAGDFDAVFAEGIGAAAGVGLDAVGALLWVAQAVRRARSVRISGKGFMRVTQVKRMG
jgi:hypothetical protein